MNKMLNIDFNEIKRKINEVTTSYSQGIVKEVIGLTIEVQGIKAFVGDLEQQASELKISTKPLKINYHY